MSVDVADWMRPGFERVYRRLSKAGIVERFGIAIAAVILALGIGASLVALAGYDAGSFVYLLVAGTFGSVGNFAVMLRHSTLLILTGVAVAIAFRAGVFNIGVQGQFVVGGFAAVVTVLALAPMLPASTVSGVLLLAVGCLVATVAGGTYAAIPGAMKAYADANEVITTIMLNFIATGVVFYFVDHHFRAEGSRAPNTETLPDYVAFPSLVFGSTSFSIVGLVVALVTVAAVAFLFRRTQLGYDLRISGRQPSAAAFAGVDPKRTVITIMTLSGMVAGLAGAVFVIMVLGYYSDPNTYPTYGFDAIAVSLLAANNPLGVIPAGILFGSLEAGQQTLGYKHDAPRQLVDGVVGLVVLFVAAPELFRMFGDRLGIGQDGDDE